MMNVLEALRLDHKVALVTGAGRGLGRAIATAYAQAGADIAGLYRTSYEEVQADVEALNRRFLPIECDLSRASVTELQQVVDKVVRDFGRLDILVNNAGIIHRTPAISYTEEDWDDVMQINLKSIFFLSQAAARVMAEQSGGKIIHIASLLAYQGGINVPAYTAAKHGLAGLTRAMANEWAAKNINVNAIAPGYFRTDNTQALQDDSQRSAALVARIPVGRWGEPGDLKAAAVFLASEASNYVHGTIIPVDGGWLSR